VRLVLATAAALLLAGFAGWAGEELGVPLPWLLGPLGVCALVAMTGLHLGGVRPSLPMWSRSVSVPVIGAAIGSSVTPAILGQAPSWWPTLLAMLPFVIAVQLANFALLRRLGGYDRPTAYFASSPGGLVDAVLLGELRGGDPAVMATLHFARIVLIVAAIPLLFALGGLPTKGPAVTIAGSWELGETALMLALAAGGAIGAMRLRLPAAPLLGPMVASAVAHLTGLTDAAMPPLLVHLAQIVVGSRLGLQFAGVGGRDVLRGFGLAGLSVALSLTIATALAAALHGFVHAPAPAVFLAFAPGGVAELGLIAVALGAEPAYVVIHHLLRIVLTVALLPKIYDRVVDRS
jgi:membrane AbrB-like protein